MIKNGSFHRFLYFFVCLPGRVVAGKSGSRPSESGGMTMDEPAAWGDSRIGHVFRSEFPYEINKTEAGLMMVDGRSKVDMTWHVFDMFLCAYKKRYALNIWIGHEKNYCWTVKRLRFENFVPPRFCLCSLVESIWRVCVNIAAWSDQWPVEKCWIWRILPRNRNLTCAFKWPFLSRLFGFVWKCCVPHCTQRFCWSLSRF